MARNADWHCECGFRETCSVRCRPSRTKLLSRRKVSVPTLVPCGKTSQCRVIPQAVIVGFVLERAYSGPTCQTEERGHVDLRI